MLGGFWNAVVHDACDILAVWHSLKVIENVALARREGQFAFSAKGLSDGAFMEVDDDGND